MAGIVGLFGSSGDEALVQRMLETIRHRGSDQQTFRAEGSLTAGAGAPMLSPARGNGFVHQDGITVLFDGEIYNDRPGGATDAEVALRLYRKHGRTFPAYLKGVFACAVYAGDELLLARDAVGVRPMYWGTSRSGHLAFASEMKALVDVVEDIVELPPATTFSNRSGLADYLPRHPEVSVPADFDEAARAVRAALTQAVQRRLEDGAVGACLLSGGLDSSIIACLVRELGSRMPLVTVGMTGAPDVENARIVADHLGMEHHVKLYDPKEIGECVQRAVRTLESFDEDCVSGAISNLFASGKAREFTNCILSGEGADELFGGYHLLKDLPTEGERLGMMHRLLAISYNTALQRLDRAMMGNGITYRTPFIDHEVIALAQQLPLRWKIHDMGSGVWMEKHILREAFKDLLPDSIYRRSKLHFAGGTGTDDCMDDITRAHFPEVALNEQTRHTPGGYLIHSPRELWYYQLFKQDFPGLHFERLVGRWDPAK